MANLFQRLFGRGRVQIKGQVSEAVAMRPSSPPPAPKPASKLLQQITAFDFGRSSRRLASIPSSQASINALIRNYGRTVVGRSRHICANNPYAVNAKRAYTSALVGTGIEPSSEVDNRSAREALNQLWTDWSNQADADGVTNMAGLQQLFASEMFEAGECFIRLRTRRDEDGLEVPLQIQLLPSEMLPYEKNEITSGSGSARIEMGIEFDAIGRRAAYHFHRLHPGTDQLNPVMFAQTVRVPANEVLHIFKPTRVGQIRGIPHTLSSLMRLALMDLYDDAELERKRTAALFAAFIRRPLDADAADNPLGESVAGLLYGERPAVVMEPGAVVDLEPGEEISFSEPADVGSSYEPFQTRNLLAIAAGFGVPYYMMTGDLRHANYGSIRAGEIAFRRIIDLDRKSIVVPQFVRPVWLRVLTAAALAGKLPWGAAEFVANLTAYSRVKYQMPKWQWIDPLNDVKAEVESVTAGFKARSDTVEEYGYDVEAVDARRAADKEREEELGLKSGPAEEEPAAPGEGEEGEEEKGGEEETETS